MTERTNEAAGQSPEVEYIDGMALIRAERQRQIDVEGYTPEHDREHGRTMLHRAAVAYRFNESASWPWDAAWWKPKDHLSNLIRAGALYMAANEADDLAPESGASVAAMADAIDGILAKAREVLSSPSEQPAHPSPEPPTGDGGREGVGRRG